MQKRVEELIDEAGLTAVYEMFQPELLKFSHLLLQEDTRCSDCKQPFKFNVNTFTTEGRREVVIRGTCKKCFDSLCMDSVPTLLHPHAVKDAIKGISWSKRNEI